MKQIHPIEPMQPGLALNRLLFMLFVTGAFFWWAAIPGWGLAWFGVIGCGIQSCVCVKELIDAHRYWTEKDALDTEARKKNRRHDTDLPNSENPPDGWEQAAPLSRSEP